MDIGFDSASSSTATNTLLLRSENVDGGGVENDDDGYGGTSYYFTSNSYTYYGETFVVFLFLLIGAALNGPLLYVYFVSNQARSIADKFLINLILADLLSLTILLPTIIVDLLLLERNEGIYLRNTTRLLAKQVTEVSSYLLRNLTTNPNSYSTLFSFSINNNSTVPFKSPADAAIFIYNNSNNQNLIGSSLDFNNNRSDSSFTSLSSNSMRRLTMNQDDVQFLHHLLDPDETLDVWCTFKKCLMSGIATASILSTLEIAMERYLAIVTPLHYHKFLTKYKVLMTSCTGAFIAIGSAVVSFFDPCEPVFPSCTRTTVTYTNTYWWPLYTLGHVTLFFIFPVVCMAGIYMKIWLEARRQKAKISSQYKKPFFLEVTSSYSAGGSMKDRPKFFLHPVILRFKVIDRFVTARMDRAARVAICTLLVTIICWSPYYYVQCAHSIRSIMEQLKGEIRVKESWSHVESTLPILAASLHPVLAPLFYGYRYTVIRDRVLMLFQLDKWFPTIRERRSNSLSRNYPSPSSPFSDFGTFESEKKNKTQVKSIKKKVVVVQTELQHKTQQARQDQDQPAHNNVVITRSTELPVKPEAATTEIKENCSIIQIVNEVENTEEQLKESQLSHTFLFTIGALDDDEDEDVNFGPGRMKCNLETLESSTTYSTESITAGSSCSSSDSLLQHCCNNSYKNDGFPDSKMTFPTNNNNTSNPSCFSTNANTIPSNAKFNIVVISSQHCWRLWSHFIQNIVHWMQDRYNSQRQSVSSTSSVVTLLSSRSISSDSLPS